MHNPHAHYWFINVYRLIKTVYYSFTSSSVFFRKIIICSISQNKPKKSWLIILSALEFQILLKFFFLFHYTLLLMTPDSDIEYKFKFSHIRFFLCFLFNFHGKLIFLLIQFFDEKALIKIKHLPTLSHSWIFFKISSTNKSKNINKHNVNSSLNLLNHKIICSLDLPLFFPFDHLLSVFFTFFFCVFGFNAWIYRIILFSIALTIFYSTQTIFRKVFKLL